MSFQKKLFKSKYLLLVFLSLMILGSGYNIKINNIHERETKSTLNSTSKTISSVLNNIIVDADINLQAANKIYSQVDYKPIWTEGFHSNQYAESLEDIIVKARYYGIRMDSDLVDNLDVLKGKMQTTKSLDDLTKLRADYELKLTNAAVSMLIQLDKGIVYLDSLKNDSVLNSYSDYLINSLQSEKFEEKLLAIQPENKIYNQLLNGLKTFLERSTLSEMSNKIDLDNFENTKKTATSIFYELGYVSSKVDLDSTNFVNTLKTFQKYHGIKQSGELCKKTVVALEMSSFDRYQQILLNIERARSEDIDESTYVYVNIPSYKLRLYHEGNLETQHKVMVGKPRSQTPVLSSKMEFMVANPKWYVPKSISRGEILYKLRKDSTYLETRDFVLLDKDYNTISQSEIDWNNINYKNFDFKIYQEPGRSNALGTIKFIFPNDYNVYVHDTQSKKLYKKDYRAYSHGCVRLENPLDFADHLLTHIDTENLYKTVKPIVKSKKTKEIKFTEPIDIHIRYYTCEVDENNLIYFYHDIYDKDEELKEQLFLN